MAIAADEICRTSLGQLEPTVFLWLPTLPEHLSLECAQRKAWPMA